MIALDNVLISDDIIEAHFVCDLHKCKGGCCVDGDCGAPLTHEEAQQLEAIYPNVKEYLPQPFQNEIEQNGFFIIDEEYGKVTPTIEGGICVYAFYDEHNIVKCGIQQAYNDGKIDTPKPISCHLYPIRITERSTYTLMNYEPRQQLCRPACKLGNKLKIPVYQFLKDPIERKFGTEFYQQLEKMAIDYRAHQGK